MTSLLTQANGVSVLTDYIYGNRFKHVPELALMGANIRLEGRSAIIEGGPLTSAKVHATDLRAGAALVIAGLTVKDGVTEVTGVEYIDRGYDHLVDNLRRLGADIWRETVSDVK
jgi:UDP-N-acetylglucosamine 1-carboxyvinyltransferase